MKYIYGVDLGGTTVKMGLFDGEGNMLEKWEIVTRKENNGEQILPDIAKAIADKNEEKSIAKEDILGSGSASTRVIYPAERISAVRDLACL